MILLSSCIFNLDELKLLNHSFHFLSVSFNIGGLFNLQRLHFEHRFVILGFHLLVHFHESHVVILTAFQLIDFDLQSLNEHVLMMLGLSN